LSRTQQLYGRGQVALSDLNRIKIQLKTAQIGLVDAEQAHLRTKLDLGSLMNLRRNETATLDLRGSINDNFPEPPPLDDLIKQAVAVRPDIASYRLGVIRATADVRLAKANAFNDVYVLWQPYTFQDNTPYGLKSATSWALGATVPMPIYNRNQGNIHRAKLNVTQTQIQLADLERQAAIDVEKALCEYEATRREVEEIKAEILPAARQVRDESYRLYVAGETSIVTFINAQLDYNQVVKQYLDTATRHRRSMLSLNTAVGIRLLP
jgi:outer membrane protein, heavy metal efflux system